MTDATVAAGFYGNEEHTVYVTPSGKIWCVQTVDLVELPRKWNELPDNFKPCGELVGPDEADRMLAEIREEFGEDATA